MLYNTVKSRIQQPISRVAGLCYVGKSKLACHKNVDIAYSAHDAFLELQSQS